MASNNYLIIGSGGREHAIAWKLSKENKNIFFMGQNAGMVEDGFNRIDPKTDANSNNGFSDLIEAIEKHSIDYVVVGPENPLASGIVDSLNLAGFSKVFGPTRNATMLESDKFFSYDINNFLKIPQASGFQAHNSKRALEYLKSLNPKTDNGIVVKARGLAAGKGVVVCESLEQAINIIPDFEKNHGPRMLLSEKLFGDEFSAFAFSDGKKAILLDLHLKDHKSLYNDGAGPNTGGMGACGQRFMFTDVSDFMATRVFNPIINEMSRRGNPFKGILYAGMMNTIEGPKVLEYNVRMGDPEAQPAMMLIENLGQIIEEATSEKGFEKNTNINLKGGAACCVVLASQGYPNEYKKGFEINGLDKIEDSDQLKVFHSGTKKENEKIISVGGRVLGVTAYGNTLNDSIAKAYENVKHIESNNKDAFHYRTDIGKKFFNYVI